VIIVGEEPVENAEFYDVADECRSGFGVENCQQTMDTRESRQGRRPASRCLKIRRRQKGFRRAGAIDGN